MERFDIESVTGEVKQLSNVKRIKRFLPTPIKQKLKSILHKTRTLQSDFTQNTLSQIYNEHPELRDNPVMVQDISSVVGFTFSQFVDAITRSAFTVTTRLHVAILSAMIGKETRIVAGNTPYHKNRGVFEFSLCELSNLELWTP